MEEFEQDPIIYTPLVKTKVKLEVVDPTGIITETHELEYKAAYYAGRAFLSIGDYKWMITGNGRNIVRIGPDPQEESKTQKLPLATRPAERPFTQEELDNLAKWLKSEEGIQKLRQAQIDAEKQIEALGLRNIDYDKLREPFTI
jgi:hypothetical protein